MNKLTIEGEVPQELLDERGARVIAYLRDFAFSEARDRGEVIIGLPAVRIWSVEEQSRDPVYHWLNIRFLRHFIVKARTVPIIGGRFTVKVKGPFTAYYSC